MTRCAFVSMPPLRGLWIAFLTLAVPSVSVQGLLVRSESSGGIATGMSLDPKHDMVLLVGTTFENEFWDMTPVLEQGECFVAFGDVSRTDNPRFSRFTMDDREAICLGGVHAIGDPEMGGSGVAHFTGMRIQDMDSEVGASFVHSVLYYEPGIVTPSRDQPTNLSPGVLPVASTTSLWSSSSAMYVASHQVATHQLYQQAGTTSPREPSLSKLLEYWWYSTSPTLLEAVLGKVSVTTTKPPRIRKHDTVTGQESYEIILESNDVSTSTLISGLALVNSPDAANQIQIPLIVVGSTNARDSADSLFGNAGKTTNARDWDGYVLFLDPEAGAVLEDEEGVVQSAIRINSIGNKDDFIEGLCVSPDGRYFYVVGTTKGSMTGNHEGGAFVQKYNLADYDLVWTYQVTGVGVQGLKCTADQEAVYLGGYTNSDLWESPLGDNAIPSPDAFVAKIVDGTAQWIQPLDTSQHEANDLRKEVIVGMEVTSQGTILVLLNSMNLEVTENDVYLVGLDPKLGQNNLHGVLNHLSDDEFPIPTFEQGYEKEQLSEEKRDRLVKIAAIAVPILLAVLLFGITYWRQRTDVEHMPQSEQRAHMEQEEIKEEAGPETAPDGVQAELL